MNEIFLVSFAIPNNFSNKLILSSGFFRIKHKENYNYVIFDIRTLRRDFIHFLKTYKPKKVYISSTIIQNIIDILDILLEYKTTYFYIGGSYAFNIKFKQYKKDNIIFYNFNYDISNIFEILEDDINIFINKSIKYYNNDIMIVFGNNTKCYYNKCFFCSNYYYHYDNIKYDFSNKIKDKIITFSKNSKFYLSTEAFNLSQIHFFKKYEREFYDNNIEIIVQSRFDKNIINKLLEFEYPILSFSFGLESFSEKMNEFLYNKKQKLEHLEFFIKQGNYNFISLNLIYTDLIFKKEFFGEYKNNFLRFINFKKVGFTISKKLIIWEKNKEILFPLLNKMNFRKRIKKVNVINNEFFNYSFYMLDNLLFNRFKKEFILKMKNYRVI